ncbi:MAG: iron-sulfur cluster assembly protein, partial [Sphingomicrobium sp.]
MGEEKKIEVEEVEAVDTPPRARLTPEVERKRDYLTGFLAEKKSEPDPSGPGGDLQEAVVEALKSIYDPEIPVNIYELGLIYDVAVDADGDAIVSMTLTTPNCPV